MEIVLIVSGVWVLYSRTWLSKDRAYPIIDDSVRRWGYLYDVPITSPPPAFYSTRQHPWRHFFLILVHCLNVIVIDQIWGWQVAALFAFCPLSVNGAAWITGGYYAVTMFLSLTAVYFIYNFYNIFGMAVASLFFTAALGSTITCIGVPFVFLLMGKWKATIMFWPLVMYLTGKRFRKGFFIRNYGNADRFELKKIPVMIKVMAYYIRLTVFPDKLAFFREFGSGFNSSDVVRKDLQSVNGLFLSSLLLVAVFIGAGVLTSPL